MTDGTRFILPAGVPRRGWTALEVDDLGEPSAVCEACGKEEIRYLHLITHREAGLTLSVGCVCAGHLTEDPAGRQAAEKLAKRKAAFLKKAKQHWQWEQQGRFRLTRRLSKNWKLTAWRHQGLWYAYLFANQYGRVNCSRGRRHPDDFILPAALKAFALMTNTNALGKNAKASSCEMHAFPAG